MRLCQLQFPLLFISIIVIISNHLHHHLHQYQHSQKLDWQSKVTYQRNLCSFYFFRCYPLFKPCSFFQHHSFGLISFLCAFLLNCYRFERHLSSAIMDKPDASKIEIPDVVMDPKDPKRKFRRGKFLGRVSISSSCLRIGRFILFYPFYRLAF